MKTGCPVPQEVKKAVFDSWLKSNGEKSYRALAGEWRLSPELVKHYMEKDFEKRFPKLIEFFGKKRVRVKEYR